MSTVLQKTLRENGLDPLKVALSSVSELYAMTEEKLLDFKTCLIRDAFAFHYEHNAFFRSACDGKGINPGLIESPDDLIRIPLIPIELFKSNDSHKLLSVSLRDVELEMRSSSNARFASSRTREPGPSSPPPRPGSSCAGNWRSCRATTRATWPGSTSTSWRFSRPTAIAKA